MAEAPAHLCQEAVVVVAEVVAVVATGLAVVEVAGAPSCLGGAGPVGAPRVGLPAGRVVQAAGVGGAGLLLPELALLQVGGSTEDREEREVSTSCLGWSWLRLPTIRMRTGPVSYPSTPT